jgi:MFS family permease
MFACVAVYGVTTIVFALSSSYLSMAVLAVLGVADMVSVVIRQTLIQVETPDDMRGRVSAVNSLFTGTANQLGEFRAGAMATLFGTTASVLIGGACALPVVVAGMRPVSGAAEGRSAAQGLRYYAVNAFMTPSQSRAHQRSRKSLSQVRMARS